jgi:hypothetical protein
MPRALKDQSKATPRHYGVANFLGEILGPILAMEGLPASVFTLSRICADA